MIPVLVITPGLARWALHCNVIACEAELVAEGHHDEHAERRLLQLARDHEWELDGDEHRCRHHRRRPT